MGDNSLHCEEEKDSEFVNHIVAIIYNSFHSNKVVGRASIYWSESANKFLKFPNHHIRVVATDKSVNRDIVLGQEIPADYFFHGDNRVIKWFKKSIEKCDKCTDVEVGKCMK